MPLRPTTNLVSWSEATSKHTLLPIAFVNIRPEIEFSPIMQLSSANVAPNSLICLTYLQVKF